MSGWKYSKERLLKHDYCAYIINPKKVICICGKAIKLNRKWEEDYLNRHAESSGCKVKEGQRSIYNFFKPAQSQHSIENSEDEWSSDVYDNMDDDDLLKIDEAEDDQIDDVDPLSTDDDLPNNTKKRLICKGLQSEQISNYIKRTPAQFGGSRRVEVVACELFPKLFSNKKFSRKKLNHEQKRKLNHVLYAESTWQIDRNSKSLN